VSEIPDEVRRLATRREEARRAKDFAAADALRNHIRDAGYEVTDTAGGPVLVPRPPDERAAPRGRVYQGSDEIETSLDQQPRFDASVQWVVQGWPEDVVRGIASFGKVSSDHSIQHVVVDLADTAVGWPSETEVVRMASQAGWAAARNAGLRRSAGRVVILADGSIEATGDVVAPLMAELEDPSVGVTGPFGIVSDDLREFRDDEGPDVDAVEAYLMALRRELVEEGLRFDEKFKFYRHADLELSLQIKAKGLRATVTRVPVTRHEHRIWTNTNEADRDRLSKRNFYRFLDRWRGRTDLLVRRHTS
jgi:Glycosyl transferase family 2